MGVLFCAGMAASLPHGTWLRLVVWSALGILMYLVYGYRHSRLRAAQPTPRGPRCAGDDLPRPAASARAAPVDQPRSAAGVSGPSALSSSS